MVISKSYGKIVGGLTMIENIDVAYCMAKLEDKIRWG